MSVCFTVVPMQRLKGLILLIGAGLFALPSCAQINSDRSTAHVAPLQGSPDVAVSSSAGGSKQQSESAVFASAHSFSAESSTSTFDAKASDAFKVSPISANALESDTMEVGVPIEFAPPNRTAWQQMA